MLSDKIIRLQSQRGAVLFVGLIMLIILTLMGIVAMKTSTMEEKLASGSMDQNTAFQAAETALRDAETYIVASINTDSGFSAACSNGLCLPSITAVTNWDAISDWTTSSIPIVLGTSTSTSTTIPGVARQPRYIIEILPDVPCKSGCSEKMVKQSPGGTAYRITAMGWGKRSTTPIMLQSIFVKI